MREKLILDACCGPRMFWFNKHHPNAVFIDIRKEPKGFMSRKPKRDVAPDVVMDFRHLTFANKTFKLVIFDPPHLKQLGQTSDMAKNYGILHNETWPYDLKMGFDECWRVLDDFGILIFK